MGNLLESDNNLFGWDIGGGAIVYFGDHFGVRGDLRYTTRSRISKSST